MSGVVEPEVDSARCGFVEFDEGFSCLSVVGGADEVGRWKVFWG